MEIERGREVQHLSSKGKRTETFRIWRSREREREKERERERRERGEKRERRGERERESIPSGREGREEAVIRKLRLGGRCLWVSP